MQITYNEKQREGNTTEIICNLISMERNGNNGDTKGLNST